MNWPVNVSDPMTLSRIIVGIVVGLAAAWLLTMWLSRWLLNWILAAAVVAVAATALSTSGSLVPEGAVLALAQFIALDPVGFYAVAAGLGIGLVARQARQPRVQT